MAMGSKAFESRLIGHVRMRAMYRGLVEVRLLAERSKVRSLRGVEACWVGTAIDLKDGDLTSHAGASQEQLWLEHVRAVGRRETGGPIKPPDWMRSLRRSKQAGESGFTGPAYDRLLCAMGMGMAQRAAGAGGVAMAYAGLAELNGAEWRRFLLLAGPEGLPLVVTVLPGESGVDLEKMAGSADAAIPVVPVDAGDAVAVYRVTQEALVRARAGRGAAIILGVRCGTDPVKLLGTQLVRKGICTKRWVDGVETHLKGLV